MNSDDNRLKDPEFLNQSRWERCLNQLKQDRSSAARLLYTFSFLEYMGARKILKSIPEDYFNEDILTHALEELRHARVLVRVARELDHSLPLGYSENRLLLKPEARRYFQGVDELSVSELPMNGPYLRYLLTTYLVEVRAGQLYPALEASLSQMGFPHRLRGIMNEEERHLLEVQTQLKEAVPQWSNLAPLLEARERELFDVWLTAVEARILGSAPNRYGPT